jgi:hypothetical protein
MLACVALMSIACKGGSAATPEPTVAVSSLDLPALLLAEESVTVQDTTLALAEGSGKASSREDTLDGSFDPERDAAELDEFGWQARRTQLYRKAQDDGLGVFFVEAALDLLDSEEHAREAVQREFADFVSDQGKSSTTSGGTPLELDVVTPFEVNALEGAQGAVLQAKVNGTTLYFTMVGLARGPLLLNVSIAVYDPRDVQAEATEIARRLEEHVTAIIEA